MRTSRILKSALIFCALFVGFTLSAGEAEISLWGFVSNNGQPLSDVVVTCSTSSDPSIITRSSVFSSTKTDIDGFYQLKAQRNMFVTYKKSGYTSQQLQVTSSESSQQHDVNMSSSSI